MGDRANIKVKQEKGSIYLYTHWGGSALPITLKKALSKRERWTDESYLTRIIFCEMVKGEEEETTGFGISLYSPDNEHNIIEVNCSRQKIKFYKYNYRMGDIDKEYYCELSFTEYIEKSDKELDTIYRK